MKNSRFCVVVTVYNAVKYIQKCIDSVKSQRYINWKCAIVDDFSDDGTGPLIDKLIENDSRFVVIHNTVKKCELENRILGKKSIVEDDEDIIVILDGDDWFADGHSLDYLDTIYRDSNVWMTYGQWQYATEDAGNCKDSYTPFCRLEPQERYLSHLRSYKFWLFEKIQDRDLRDDAGDYFKVAGDIAVLYPLAEMAGSHLKFTPRVSYIYNNRNPIMDCAIHREEQIAVDSILQRRETYNILESKQAVSKRKLSISLFDTNFQHSKYSGADINDSRCIEWDREGKSKPYTIYTDKCLSKVSTSGPDSNIKIAWIIEPQVISPDVYVDILKNYLKFDYVFTHDAKLLNILPNSLFIPASQTWISREDFRVYDKTFDTLFICSSRDQTVGHQFRHKIIERLGSKIAKICGRGHNPFENKIDVLRDSRYNIVVQNCKTDFYFTEHLIDCFLTGTIPIFWGCPYIWKFFNRDGILTFDTIEELSTILNIANENLYKSRLAAVKDNFQRAHKYVLAEDYMYNYFFRRLEAGVYPL